MINTLTLNPAIDSLLFIDRFERTVTARIREKAEALGGKGVHISVNLSLLGEPNQAFGVLFGGTGKHIEDVLTGMGVTTRFVFGEGRDSRINYVVIEETGESTIIADRGVDLTEEDIELTMSVLADHTADGDILVLSGDASNVADPYIYNRFIDALGGRDVKVFVDASGRALDGALEAAPFLIKPNRDELESVTGIEIRNDEDALRAISSLERYGIKNIALSLGAEGSIVKFADGGVLRALPLKVAVRNTAGCGDAFLSGLIAGFARGWDAERTLRTAAAISAATAADPLTVGFDREYAESLSEQVKIEALI